MDNQKDIQIQPQGSGTDVLDVSRETSDKKDIYEQEKEKKPELDLVRKKGQITDDNPFDNNNPTFKELYRNFRSNKLSVIESGFNAMYLRCYDNYYSSGVPVKDKYKNIYAHPSAWFKNTHHMWKHNKWSVAVKLLEIVPATGRFFNKIGDGMSTIKRGWKNFFGNGHSIRKALNALFSLCAIVGTVAILAYWGSTYFDTANKIPAFKLYINGNYAGDILSRSDAENAKISVEQIISRTCKTAYNLDCEILYEPTKINKGTNLTKAGVTQAFQTAAHEDLVPGYGLYMYDTLLVVVENESWLSDSLDEITSRYVAKELVSAGSITTGGDVGNNLRIIPGNYLENQFSTYDEMRQMFSLSSDDEETAITLTADNEIPETLKTAEKTPVTLPGNSVGTATDVGENLDTAEQTHIIPLKQTKTTIVTVQEKIPFSETIRYDDSLPETKRMVTKKGKQGLRIAVYQVVLDGENEVSREFISETVLTEPSNQIVTKGTRPLSEEEQRTKSTGTYILPAKGTITSGYSWRSWGSYNEFHKGVDFDDDVSSDIVASDGGVVIQAGNKGDGYGLCILIEHDDGTITRYAHCSTMYVEVGERVAQNQPIGLIGATGWVTGSHLHFEIIKDGQTVNPSNYLIFE